MDKKDKAKMKRSLSRRLTSFLLTAVLMVAMLGVPAGAQTIPPVAPTGLVVVAVNGGQTNLSWTDNSLDETQFRIQRSSSEEFDPVEEFFVGPGVTSYTDFGVLGLRSYFYRVFAMNDNGSSLPSNEVRIFTPASSPTVAVVTPAGSPAVFQSGIDNLIAVSATGIGNEIASAEYQLLLNDLPGTLVAQDIEADPDPLTPLTVPATLAASPANDTTIVPELPAGAIVEFQIYGRVTQAGIAGNSFEWRIGDAPGPTFVVYESADTVFARRRHPVAGDAVWITALRTAAPGPLVAEHVTFRAPDPQPVAPAAYKVAGLLKGVVQAIETAFTKPGVSYGGTIWDVFSASANVAVPFRVDSATNPAFHALIDEGLVEGNAVEVRFWVSTPTTSLPIARQIFPQVQSLELPPINPSPESNDDPVALGLPPGTRLQFLVLGIITAQDLDTLTWTLGLGEESVTVYGHSLTIPLSDAFRVVPNIGDEVIITARRTLTPGPLIADQIFILTDGPGPDFELAETRIEVYYLYNGTVTDTGGTSGGTRWTVSVSGVPQEFVMNDPDEPAVVDRGPLASIGLGTPVTVAFEPPTQLLPEDNNWESLTLGLGAQWTAAVTLPAARFVVLPAVSAVRTGTLFVRTTDIANQGSTIAIPAQLLPGPQFQKLYMPLSRR